MSVVGTRVICGAWKRESCELLMEPVLYGVTVVHNRGLYFYDKE